MNRSDQEPSAAHQIGALCRWDGTLWEPLIGLEAEEVGSAAFLAQQKQGESYHQLMERYQTCDALGSDDLGAEKLTDWVEEQFYLLVDYRYRQRLPVFASSNCRKEALAQRLDRRVLERLQEMCTMLEVRGRTSGIEACSTESDGVGSTVEGEYPGRQRVWRGRVEVHPRRQGRTGLVPLLGEEQARGGRAKRGR